MSSRANREKTYTAVNCYKNLNQETFYLQDYQPLPVTDDTETLDGTESSTTKYSIPTSPLIIPSPPPPNSTPVGAIVGGVVGGLAIIVILVLGILFYRQQQRSSPGPAVEQVNALTTQRPNQAGFAPPIAYNGQTGNNAWWPINPDPNAPTYDSAAPHSQDASSTSPTQGQPMVVHISQEPKEVPAVNPVGTDHNRAELN